MPDITVTLWIIFIGIIVLVVGTIIVNIVSPYDEPKYIHIRPILKSKDLDQWTKIYQSISINYHGWVNEEEVAEGTWYRWSVVTGKKQWKRVPNPDYIEPSKVAKKKRA